MKPKHTLTLLLLSLIFVIGCTTNKSHNPNIVLHPDQYVIISDTSGDMLEVLIPEAIDPDAIPLDYKMTYYGWVEAANYKGWTIVKKQY